MKGIHSKLAILAGGAAFLVFMNSCWYNPKEAPPPPPVPNITIKMPKPQPLSSGSLYRDNYFPYTPEDHRAFRVGDIITVKIVESYQTSDTVSQKSQKSSSSSAGIDTILGYENKINQFLPYANPAKLFGGSMQSSTQGQSQISRQSKIVATISARVIKVLPNGNLVIEGIRRIKRNKDLEYITLSGIVRPEDIGPDNTVLSTQIADAYIEYSGRGPNADATSGPGIITRLLQALWPF